MKRSVLFGVCVLVLLFAAGSQAAKPQLQNLEDDDMFSVFQDQTHYIFIHALDADGQYPLNFTSEALEVGFEVFSMRNYNSTSARINFTPDNDDIGNYTFLIIVRDTFLEYDQAQVTYVIINVNDPPNITSWVPVNQTPRIGENETLQFSHTATDPDLQHGDVLTSYWIFNQLLMGENSSSYDYVPGFCDWGHNNITIRVEDLAKAADSVEWNVSVSNVNRAPVYNESTPIQNITWYEDTNLSNNITLFEHFYDLDNLECTGQNKDPLSYSASDTQKIVVQIHENESVSFYPPKDWAGTETVYFYINDSYNITSSGKVRLTVINVNDPPTLYNRSYTAAAYVPFSAQVNATDPDVVYGDVLFYSSSIVNGSFSCFNMNWGGLISFQADDTCIGNHTINYSVSDNQGVKRSGLGRFEVRENHPPAINPLTDISVTEARAVIINISGYDPDYDVLNFSSNFTKLVKQTINDTAAVFAFIPRNEDTGVHIIKFTVRDVFGATDTAIMRVTVGDINVPPVLDLIYNITATVNETYLANITASDDDGNLLFFSTNDSNFSVFTLDPAGGIGLMNFTAPALGNYSVLVSVSDGNLSDSQIVRIEVSLNRPPIIYPIPGQNATTGVQFIMNITAIDRERNNITFSTNYSRLSISYLNITTNRTTLKSIARLSMTPIYNETGWHNITVTADDGAGGIARTTFVLNITFVNHPPYFGPHGNFTCTYNLRCSIIATGYDDDAHLLSFGIAPNITQTHANSTLFSSTKRFNFTPRNSSISRYTFNVSISDGLANTSELFHVTLNRAPVIIWVIPNGTEATVAENRSLTFMQNSTDPEDDPLNFTWHIARLNETHFEFCDGLTYTSFLTCENNSQGLRCRWNPSYGTCNYHPPEAGYVLSSVNDSWAYQPNFTAAGHYLVMFTVTDLFGANASAYWNVTVNNSNRQIVFGTLGYGCPDFPGGSFNNTRLNEDCALVLNDTNGTYRQSGLYFSSKMEVGPAEEYNLSKIYAKGIIDAAPGMGGLYSTNISFWTRTSRTGLSYNWSGPIRNGTKIISPPLQDLEFYANLSSGGNNTPKITDIEIKYVITNKTWTKNTRIMDWIDLDDFFNDPDTDDSIQYSVYGNAEIEVLISNGSNTVMLNPENDFVGEEIIIFNATDGYSMTASNRVLLTVISPDVADTPQQSGGGGKSPVNVESPKTLSKTDNSSRFVAFDILTPGLVTTYENDTVIVPIYVQNSGNKTLKGIHLSGEVGNENIKLNFSQTYIEELPSGETVEVSLIMFPQRAYGEYEVLITAEVDDPKITDRAKFFIHSLEKGKDNRTQLNTKISFTKDLLQENPECLELNELLTKASGMINSSQFAEAEKIITNVVESCRYLISLKERNIEVPQSAGPFSRIKGRIMSNKGIFFATISLLSTTLLIFAYYFFRRRKQ
ncbi:MAG: tandem-95 repeat protein [archaeon]